MRQESLEILQTLKDLDSKGELIGVYDDIPIDVYHHPECPGYSSTIIKRIVAQSYNHWYCSKDKSARSLEFGNAFHCFINEPHLFNEFYRVIQTESRKTGEWRAAKAENSDKILITIDDFECIKVMSTKLFQHPDIGPFLKGAEFERTYFSRDEETGLLKKCRLDIRTTVGKRIIWDLKSTIDASPFAFRKQMQAFFQRISSAFYLEVASEATGDRHDEFRLVACEKLEPREVKVYRVPESSIETAQSEIRGALKTIANILREGPSAWKGYQLGVEDLYI